MKQAGPGRIGPVLATFGVLVSLWLLAPVFAIVPVSFTNLQSFRFPPPSYSTRWYDNLFSSSQWLSAIFNSFEIAALVSCLATVLGTAAAFGIARSRSRAALVVQALLILPMIAPVIVVAVGIYALFIQWGLVGTLSGFVLAHTVLALPMVVIVVGSRLKNFEWQLLQAAAICGSPPAKSFFTVALPGLLPAIAISALFAFITSMDEVVISLFIVSPRMQTLPVQLYYSMIQQVDPTVAAAATMILGLTISALIVVGILRGKS
jgi:putative spermidine/putrescine transport system permease protein